MEWREQVVSDTQIECQIRSRLPVVLHENGPFGRSEVEGLIVTGDDSVGGEDRRPAEEIIRLDISRTLRLSGPVLELPLQAARPAAVHRRKVARACLHPRMPGELGRQ